MTKKIELTKKQLITILQVATGNVQYFVMDNEKFIHEQLEFIKAIPSCTELFCDNCEEIATTVLCRCDKCEEAING